MAYTWAKAGMGCVLLWASACGGVPEEAFEAGQGVAEQQVQELQLSSERNTPGEQRSCDRTGLQRMESAARELAGTSGCEDVSQCRTAPVGALACGGPRDYLVYCAASTNERALLRLLERLERREERFNQRCGVVSICIFIPPPEVELVDGECREVEPDPIPLP